jgi:hypothetical protein
MKIKYYRSIIFCRTPLETNFRFNDLFQIYPCDFENSPKSERNDEIPIVIEYWVDEDENPEVSEDLIDIKSFVSSSTNQINKLNRITRLLTATTNHRFSSGLGSGISWGITLPEQNNFEENEEEYNNQSSQNFINLYYYPNMAKDLKITEFSKQIHSDSKLVSHKEYFINDPFDDKTKIITFPNTIKSILENYLNLDIASRKIVDTVAHLICNGIDLKLKMKSISFLTLVSSIETLVNFEYKNQKEGIKYACNDCQTLQESPIKCKNCGRPIWGVRAKFKSFLKTYVASSSYSVKKYNRIYDLRCNIVHDGLLLLGDEQFDWTKSEKEDSQWLTHIETIQLARLSLVNWILLRQNK